MADNIVLNLGAGGDTSRAIDKSGVKTQVVTFDLGGSGGESLVSGGVMPISGTVTLTGIAALATTAKQDTGNTSLASIDGKLTAKSVQPLDTDSGQLVRMIAEDNAHTQHLLESIVSLLRQTFGLTAAAGVPALNVNAFQATAASLNVTVAANAGVNLAQVAAATVHSVVGTAAPGTSANTEAVVAQSQAYHLPILPAHLYSQITAT